MGRRRRRTRLERSRDVLLSNAVFGEKTEDKIVEGFSKVDLLAGNLVSLIQACFLNIKLVNRRG